MRLWGATCGALLGWLAADFEPFGLILGGLFGLLAGLWLHSSAEGLARATLKRIVDAELKDYIAQQIELALAAREGAPPPAPAAPAPQASVPVTRRAAAAILDALPAAASV